MIYDIYTFQFGCGSLALFCSKNFTWILQTYFQKNGFCLNEMKVMYVLCQFMNKKKSHSLLLKCPRLTRWMTVIWLL